MMKHKLPLLAVLITALAIPQTVKAYDFSAVAPSGQTVYYSYLNGSNSGNVYVTYPSSYSWDPWRGFVKPTGSLIIPDSVTYNNNTFAVTRIGSRAFSGCGNLIISIPNPVLYISEDAFSGVPLILYHGSATGNPWGAKSVNGILEGDFVYADSTKTTLSAYIGAGGCVAIPNTVDTIGADCFYNCTSLTSVSIPNTVIAIEERSFYGCSGLTSVLIPDSVEIIKAEAFLNCSMLDSLTIGNSVKRIGPGAFGNCKLSVLIFGDSVKSIGRLSFHTCANLTSVTLPNSLIDIGTESFANCSNLTSVTMGECVMNIQQLAFNNCTKLSTIIIPSSVVCIGQGVFFGCDSLASITIMSRIPPVLTGDIIEGYRCNIPIYVPCGSVNDYHEDENWNGGALSPNDIQGISLTNIIEMACAEFDVQTNDTAFGTVLGGGMHTQGESVTLTAISSPNYVFSGWSNGETSNPYTIIAAGDTSITAFFSTGIHDTINIHDTIVIHDTIIIRDTMLIPVHDTTIVHDTAFFAIHDTIILHDSITIFDTTYIHLQDTIIKNIYHYDTSIYNNFAYDTSIYNHYRYDTTLVFDTMIVNVYTYDTSIYNNYRFDTVILNTYQYDTMLVNVYDTIINNYYQYDTTIVFDTTIINIFDTTIVNNYQYDTIIINNYVYDTVIINNYTHDTVNNYYYDTVNNYFYDTVVISHYYHDTVIINNYVYDTIYLYKYLQDTIYIHDTIYVDSNDVEDEKTVEARIFQRDGQIVVELDEGSESLDVQVYDAVGRLLATRQGTGVHGGTPVHFDVPAAGAYLVRIGNHPARRIVIVR